MTIFKSEEYTSIELILGVTHFKNEEYIYFMTFVDGCYVNYVDFGTAGAAFQDSKSGPSD